MTPRSTSSYSFFVKENSFEIKESGQGAFHQFDLVDWHIHATGAIKNHQLIQHDSLCTIHDLQGAILYEARKTFHYDKKEIIIEINDYTNPRRARKRNFTYPLKGLTVDEACLKTFVKSFVPDLEGKGFSSFYFITFEPALYRVLVKPEGHETLQIAGHQYDCVKIRLIADMGILAHVFDRYVPPTFLWYEKNYPFRWIQYQGLETGRFSANILSQIIE